MTLPTLNVLLRMHFRKRGRLLRTVQEEVWAALIQSGHKFGGPPVGRCEIHVRRFSRREPDPDGMKATAKLLLDVLQPSSKRHPCGIGLIAEDSDACIARLIVEHAAGSNRTDVVIRALE